MKKKEVIAATLLLVLSMLLSACAPVTAVTLPKEAQKLSEVVPRMGEHWAIPKGLPLGPLYLVHQGKVIGMEYMYTQEMLKETPVPPPAQEELGPVIRELDPLPVGATINHMTVSFNPQGHAGFTVPHYDAHLYFITPEERNKVIPAGPPPK
ncbi:MAG: hypothetical protein HYU85_01440 [Chloroflexi bacterium]|nr:hypothetical protein [Chloroflexota bacterium]